MIENSSKSSILKIFPKKQKTVKTAKNINYLKFEHELKNEKQNEKQNCHFTAIMGNMTVFMQSSWKIRLALFNLYGEGDCHYIVSMVKNLTLNYYIYI